MEPQRCRDQNAPCCSAPYIPTGRGELRLGWSCVLDCVWLHLCECRSRLGVLCMVVCVMVSSFHCASSTKGVKLCQSPTRLFQPGLPDPSGSMWCSPSGVNNSLESELSGVDARVGQDILAKIHIGVCPGMHWNVVKTKILICPKICSSNLGPQNSWPNWLLQTGQNTFCFQGFHFVIGISYLVSWELIPLGKFQFGANSMLPWTERARHFLLSSKLTRAHVEPFVASYLLFTGQIQWQIQNLQVKICQNLNFQLHWSCFGRVMVSFLFHISVLN